MASHHEVPSSSPHGDREPFASRAAALAPALALTLALLASAAPLQGQVSPAVGAPGLVDFEDIPVPANEDIDTGDFSSGGFFFDVSNDHANFANGELYFLGDPIAYNGTTVFFLHGWYEDGWVHPSVTMTPESGGTFTLHQMDLSEAGFFSDAWTLGITGLKPGGEEVSRVHVFDGILDGTGPLEDYQTATFDQDWSGLQSLTMVALTGYKQAEWTLDDIVVTLEGAGGLDTFDDGGSATPDGPAAPTGVGGGAGASGIGPSKGTVDPAGGSGVAAPPWLDLGGGLSGHHAPALVGRGAPVPGRSILLQLQDARPDAEAVLVIGLSYLGAPFSAGLLGPAPDLIVSPLHTDGDGALVLRDRWPTHVPPLRLWFQAWITDPGAPAGRAASNTLLLDPL